MLRACKACGKTLSLPIRRSGGEYCEGHEPDDQVREAVIEAATEGEGLPLPTQLDLEGEPVKEESQAPPDEFTFENDSA